ncbi:hypothetical protein MBLNU13_g02428t1 [Cladosporium sp. NU13]
MEQKIAEMKPSKSDINSVIMDYLISEGYPGAAEKFANETNLFQGEAFDVESIRDRVQIRNAILGGNIEEAIELLNNDETLILDDNPLLHFKLMQLQLVEIIRSVLEKNNGKPASADFRPALEFATTQLSPRAPTDPKYLSALEKTMALMIFDADKMIPEMKELLDLGLRETVAGEVNKAILQSKGMQPEARIRELVRARAWAEAQAKALDVLPSNIDIGLDGEGMVDNDAMVTGRLKKEDGKKELSGRLLGVSGRVDGLQGCYVGRTGYVEIGHYAKADDLALVLCHGNGPLKDLGKLPRELRDEVYKHAFPRTFWQCYNTKLPGITLLDVTHSSSLPDILDVSKAIREEVFESVYCGRKLFIGIQVPSPRTPVDTSVVHDNVGRIVALLNSIALNKSLPPIRVSFKTNQETSSLQNYASDFEALLGPLADLELGGRKPDVKAKQPLVIDRLPPYSSSDGRDGLTSLGGRGTGAESRDWVKAGLGSRLWR